MNSTQSFPRVRTAFSVVLVLMIATLIVVGLLSLYFKGVRDASADPIPGSGSAAVISAGSAVGSAASAPTVTVPSVTADPIAFFDQVKSLWHGGGWAVALLLGVVGVLELAAWAGGQTNISWLAWLGKGRVSLVIGGGVSVGVAMLGVLLGAGSWTAALAAAAAAALAYWHQAGTDPKKA